MPWEDPIVEEVRKARDAYAKRFNYDLDAIYRDLKEKERKSGRVVVQTHLLSIRSGRPDKRDVVPPKVKLSDGMWAVIRVSDTSPGLSEATQYALTAPRADPEAGKTGPGLSMGEIRMIA